MYEQENIVAIREIYSYGGFVATVVDFTGGIVYFSDEPDYAYMRLCERRYR